MENSKFAYDIISDSNYDHLIADVLFEDELLFDVSQDNGPTHPKISFFFSKNRFNWVVPVMPMYKIIHEARVDLNENLTEEQIDIFCKTKPKYTTNDLTYELIYDSQDQKNRALIFYKNNRMCELYMDAHSKEWYLKIFADPKKELDSRHPHWEFYLLDFYLVIDEAKKELIP